MILFFFLVPLFIILVGLMAMAALLFAGCRLLVRKHYFGGSAAFFVLLIFVGVFYWLFSNSIEMPSKEQLQAAINDGLQKDCMSLSSSAPRDGFNFLDKKYWPKSIMELHPRRVFVAGDAVLLCLWHNCPEWERQFDIMNGMDIDITLEVEADTKPHDFSRMTAVYAKVYDGIYLSYRKWREPRIRSSSDILDGATFSGGHEY